MPTPARVVVVPGEPGPLQLVEMNLPDPGPYQVVVKQYASGICHSQLHQMHRPRTGTPQILGHESTGVVIAKAPWAAPRSMAAWGSFSTSSP